MSIAAPVEHRSLTARKREQIVAAAERLFVESGYGAVSMDAIAAEARVSKRTVYSHFENKQTLFVSVMDSLCARIGGSGSMSDAGHDGICPVRAAIAAGGDASPPHVLTAVGRRFLSILLSPEGVRLFRIVIGEAGRFPELGRSFYEAGPGSMSDGLTDYLAGQAERGALRISDPRRAAWHFMGAVKDPIHMQICLGMRGHPARAEIAEIVDDAVARYLGFHSYSPNG